ncbi:MAG: RNA polymerase sigma factor [Saprospiraceae bacterium]|nr:RNA polymerase sigma factor [Lewinella sp.]
MFGNLRQGQEELYRRYAGKIYHKCISLVRDQEAAKDLTHDIFIKIFIHLVRYNHKGPFYSWVFAITYNCCYDYLKKRNKFRTISLDDETDLKEDNSSELQYKLFKEAELEALKQAFTELKPAERVILTMYYADKMSIKSIALLLRAGESAIKMRLKRSREHLAETVKKNQNEPL